MNSNTLDRLTSRALLYRLLAAAFAYPTEKLLVSLSSRQYFEGFVEVLAPLGGRLVAMTDTVRKKINEEAQAQGLEGFEIEYNRIFQLSHVDACPLTASEYMKGESRQAMAVAQLRGLYRSFGVTTRQAREPDHLSILCEFMSLLCAKESLALNHGVQQRVDDCVAAQAIVIEDYLGFVPLLQKSVLEHAVNQYYLWISAVTVEFIALERDLFLLTAASSSS